MLLEQVSWSAQHILHIKLLNLVLGEAGNAVTQHTVEGRGVKVPYSWRLGIS